jgi:FKBP-type peptidyl-prolyl cis-trans isomerase
MTNAGGISCCLLAVCFCIFTGCRKKEQEQRLSRKEYSEQKELVDRANKYLVRQDKELIEAYAARHGWDMRTTESGLYYDIYHAGNGPRAVTGKYALINYNLSLLDGTPCYSSEESGPKKFLIGPSDEETGLIQGILMMHEGDRARFILPPHIAHGLLGDENRIPPRSVIVYEVELLKISDR